MSWILGFIGASLSPSLRERLVALHDVPRHHAEDAASYVALGGLPETCHFGLFTDASGEWAVVGLGIERHNDHCTFLTSEDWRTRLTPAAPDLGGLDGHYVALRRQPRRWEAFTDRPGVRTLYAATIAGGLAFSTRLDWLARLQGNAKIDFEAFGAHWLTFNQLSTTSLVRDIRRLGPGGHMVWTPRSLDVTERPWMPDIAQVDASETAFGETLAAFVNPRSSDGYTLSLGLSGGLDSRLLLAMCAPDQPITTHVFGPDHHPDVKIAQQIARREHLRQHRFDEPIPDLDACLSLLRRQVARTQAVSAASSVLGLRYYPALHDQEHFMIDGGLGEAARRQFMNRLLRRGRDALHAGDPAAILPYLHVPRADVFNEETQVLMKRGAQQQLEALWQTLPAPAAVGEETFLDMLGIRTRLPNFFGFEQNRLDEEIRNYMPFAQPSLLQAVFQTPVSLRRNGRLFRRLIRARRPSLAQIPLVKGGVSYPFAFPTLPAYAWTKIKTALGRGFTDTSRLYFLETVKPFALDAVHSRSVATFPAYDHPRLVQLVEGYYEGRTELATQVDWWLAFEMWRRVLDAA